MLGFCYFFPFDLSASRMSCAHVYVSVWYVYSSIYRIRVVSNNSNFETLQMPSSKINTYYCVCIALKFHENQSALLIRSFLDF